MADASTLISCRSCTATLNMQGLILKNNDKCQHEFCLPPRQIEWENIPTPAETDAFEDLTFLRDLDNTFMDKYEEDLRIVTAKFRELREEIQLNHDDLVKRLKERQDALFHNLRGAFEERTREIKASHEKLRLHKQKCEQTHGQMRKWLQREKRENTRVEKICIAANIIVDSTHNIYDYPLDIKFIYRDSKNTLEDSIDKFGDVIFDNIEHAKKLLNKYHTRGEERKEEEEEEEKEEKKDDNNKVKGKLSEPEIGLKPQGKMAKARLFRWTKEGVQVKDNEKLKLFFKFELNTSNEVVEGGCKDGLLEVKVCRMDTKEVIYREYGDAFGIPFGSYKSHKFTYRMNVNMKELSNMINPGVSTELMFSIRLRCAKNFASVMPQENEEGGWKLFNRSTVPVTGRGAVEIPDALEKFEGRVRFWVVYEDKKPVVVLVRSLELVDSQRDSFELVKKKVRSVMLVRNDSDYLGDFELRVKEGEYTGAVLKRVQQLPAVKDLTFDFIQK